MEITITRKDGKSEKVHSKLNGDGAFNQNTGLKSLQKLIAFVEA